MDVGERLRRELGTGKVLEAPDPRLVDYGRDESNLPGVAPQWVALCGNDDEVAAVMRVAVDDSIPLTPRGAGSGKAGGCIPHRGGIVLALHGMNRILDIDAGDLTAEVEPGVITGDLQTAVDELGLYYPPDPASLGYCTLGGNIATNAGGPRAFRHGVTREYVLGLHVSLMSGQRLTLGRRTVKGVSGFDLMGPFIGSEGCLGIATRARLKLVPKPQARNTVLALFANVDTALDSVNAVLRGGHFPSAMEILDSASLAAVADQMGVRSPGSAVLFEVEGDQGTVESQALGLGGACEKAKATEVLVATSATEMRRLWDARRSVSTALKDLWPRKVSEDICVPRGSLRRAYRELSALAAELDLGIAAYGHVGDGNLHVNLLDATGDHPRMSEAIRRVFAITVELGGTLSGEHGIGLSKRDYMSLEHSRETLEWFWKLKRLFDPDLLLNPGKVLPSSP